MPIDGKLHNVPCVQLSFSNDNTILSGFVEWAVNVIADSVDSAFSTIIIWGNPCIQAATVIWVGFAATSWLKTHGNVLRTSPPWRSLLKKDDSEVWRSMRVASIHWLEKQYTTKLVERNLTLWCSGAVSWFDLHYSKTNFVELHWTLKLPFCYQSITHKQNLKSVVWHLSNCFRFAMVPIDS